MIYLAFFFFDILYNLFSGYTQIDFKEDARRTEIIVPVRVVCSFVLLFFLKYECKQLLIQGWSYIKDFWNICDFSLTLFYTTMIILEHYTDETNQKYLILVQVIAIVLSFMKLFFFLRTYDDFSFLVSMLGGVFSDIKYFVAFYLIIVL